MIPRIITSLQAHLGPKSCPQRGQATAEYALVLLAAATLATLVLTWASSTSRISSLFDLVFRSVSRMLS